MTEVVLPFVPVTPTSCSRAAGRPYHASAAIAAARRPPPLRTHDLRNPDRLSHLDQRRCRAARRGIRDKTVAVEHRAAHGAKQHTALETSRVRGQARDLRQRVGRVDPGRRHAPARPPSLSEISSLCGRRFGEYGDRRARRRMFPCAGQVW